MSSLQPTLANERIDVLDVLRGMAIFGILFVNLAHFSYPDMYLSMLGKENFLQKSGLKQILQQQPY